MEILKINIKEIKPYENNVKMHPKQQIEQIKHSIVEFGNNDPIAIDENNVIIEGHGRYFALQELGYEKVECIVLKNLTEEQKQAYRLVHNKLTMNSDFDIAGLEEELKKIVDIDIGKYDFDLEEIEKQLSQLNDENREAEEDNFDVDGELNSEEETIAKYGDVYQLGNHRLMCGDSTKKKDVEKLVDGNEIDLVITDPPYNVDYDGNAGKIINDNLSNNEFKNFLVGAFSRMYEVMKEGAPFYVWYASREHINFESSLNECNLPVRQQLIWVKSSFTLGRQDYQRKHEPCLYGWKDGAAHYFIYDRTQDTIFEDKPNFNKMNKKELIEYIKQIQSDNKATTVIEEGKPVRSALHPTMKPIRLLGRLIKNSSRERESTRPFRRFGLNPYCLRATR